MKRIDLIVGARPNFVKVSRLIPLLKKDFIVRLIHTGQHYDYKMNKLFYKELSIPEPGYYLDVKGKTNSEQTALIIKRYSEILKIEKPDLTIVVGDVNSTMAASIAAKQNFVSLSHIEAGLRSFDNTMPEELNRIITDRISDLLFVPSYDALENLGKEGISQNKIYFVGNIMIDTLVAFMPKIEQSNILQKLRIEKKNYALLTMHRPSNVDNKDSLLSMIDILNQVANRIQIVFPIHPRTKTMIQKFNLQNRLSENILEVAPLGYFDLIKLEKYAKFVITDSGGIQEETTYLNVPCLTIRKSTERPITVFKGSNILVNHDKEKILSSVDNILSGKAKKSVIPDLWDGKTSERIVKILKKKLP